MDINAIFSKIRKIVVSDDFYAGVLCRRSYYNCHRVLRGMLWIATKVEASRPGVGPWLATGLGCVGALWLRPWQSSNFRVANCAQMAPDNPNCQPGAKCARVLRHGHSRSGSPELIFAPRANPLTLLMLKRIKSKRNAML